MGKNYYILKALGLAAICIHIEKAATIFKVTSVINDLDEEMINKVAKIIKADIAKKKQCFDIFIFKEGHSEWKFK